RTSRQWPTRRGASAMCRCVWRPTPRSPAPSSCAVGPPRRWAQRGTASPRCRPDRRGAAVGDCTPPRRRRPRAWARPPRPTPPVRKRAPSSSGCAASCRRRSGRPSTPSRRCATLPSRIPPADPPTPGWEDATAVRPPEPALQGGERVELLAASLREITRQNERLFGELMAGERRYRGLARSVWNVQEAERRRLARDLHDGIGQTLTALKQQLDVVEQSASLLPEFPEAARARLHDAAELAAQALHETRELSRLLRPQILDDLGLEPALRWLTRTFSERTGLALEVDLVGIDGRLQSDLETLAYRVVQEALNNVGKHAAASRAQVLARCERGELELVVADDGRGFDAAAPESDGSGLRGLRDRVELFGGRIDIGSRPGRGTRIAARVPCAAASTSAGEEGGAS